MSLQESFVEFLGENGYCFDVEVIYSGRLGKYNANVRKKGNQLRFSLGKEWKEVNDEIVLGLLQSLTSRLVRVESRPVSIGLYNNFIRNLHLSMPKTGRDMFLEESFCRVNEKYFDGLVEMPNFAWHDSRSRLASYNYHSDTVSVSMVFRGRKDIIDYLMYHELLHKKMKFGQSKSRTVHHSSLFRKKESEFENADFLEREIRNIIRKRKFL